jgi:putative ABC transport system substrate-binding protein
VIYDDPRPEAFDPFYAHMRDLGYVDGATVVYDRRGPEAGEIPDRAKSLVALGTEVIVVGASGHLVRQATTTTPIVTLYAPDPVELGLVSSLARPGGNVTGLATLTTDLGAKQLEALRDVLPGMRNVGVLYAPTVKTGPAFAQLMRQVALDARLTPVLLELGKPEDLEATFRSAPSLDGVVVQDSGPTATQLDLILTGVARYRWPTVWSRRYVVEEKGGFLSYGHDFDALMRRGAEFVDRILKGARPGDLPMEWGTKFELAVNLRTASALGVTIPQTMLARADVVVR